MLSKFFLALAALGTTTLAWAQDAAPAAAPKGPSMLELVGMPVGFFAIMYFLIIRPQQKRQRQQGDFIAGLKPGDEVVTSGGIIGKVRSVAESFVTVEIANNTSVKVLKANVSGLTKDPKAVAATGQEKPAKA